MNTKNTKIVKFHSAIIYSSSSVKTIHMEWCAILNISYIRFYNDIGRTIIAKNKVLYRINTVLHKLTEEEFFQESLKPVYNMFDIEFVRNLQLKCIELIDNQQSTYEKITIEY